MSEWSLTPLRETDTGMLIPSWLVGRLEVLSAGGSLSATRWLAHLVPLPPDPTPYDQLAAACHAAAVRAGIVR